MPKVSIELPQVGESVVEGIIDRWLKKPGDRVGKYDPLVEVVTDKVNMEVPSPYEGVLTRILVEEGTTVPMGTIIAEMETDEPAPAQVPEKPVAATPEASTIGTLVDSEVSLGPTGAMEAEKPPTPTKPAVKQQAYSPVVLKLAREHDVNLSLVKGTGINSRVTKKDILQFIESRGAGEISTPQPVAPEATRTSADVEEEVQLRPVRRIIARHMAKSSSEIPHAWAMVEADVTNLVSLREALRSEFHQKEGLDITVLPFVIKAVAESLKENPLVNSTWRGDKIVLKKQINIGMAVGAPDGLVVPVIHRADSLSIAELNRFVRDLADRAHQGKLTLDDVQGGTFTLNNTGALGTILSQPIINYPQAGILTTEVIQKRPMVINDAIAIRSMMNVCLSFDHRILDGLEAGAFLQAVKGKLEGMGPDTPIY